MHGCKRDAGRYPCPYGRGRSAYRVGGRADELSFTLRTTGKRG